MLIIISSFVAMVDCSLKKKSMKRLTCRKCEGHGFTSILKGHASCCPFNDCNCGTCSSVMNMRANALIRRFRHRQPGQQSAILKAIRSKNGNMRLRIVANNGTDETGTTVTYNDEKKYETKNEFVPTTSSTPENGPVPVNQLDIVNNQLIQQLLTLYQQQLQVQQLMKPLIPAFSIF